MFMQSIFQGDHEECVTKRRFVQTELHDKIAAVSLFMA